MIGIIGIRSGDRHRLESAIGIVRNPRSASFGIRDRHRSESAIGIVRNPRSASLGMVIGIVWNPRSASSEYALDRAQGGASTYHMRKILDLMARIGRERIVDALRYATGYEAFSHAAVTRITRARRISGSESTIQASLHEPTRGPETQPPSEPSDEHQRPLSHYQALLTARSHHDPEDPDGQ